LQAQDSLESILCHEPPAGLGTNTFVVFELQNIKFDERGLIPAILQDASTSDVIGLYQMNNECLVRTLSSGRAVFLEEAGGGFVGGRFRLVDVRLTAAGGALSVLVERADQNGGDIGTSLLPEINRAAPAEVSLVDVGSLDFGIAINKLYDDWGFRLRQLVNVLAFALRELGRRLPSVPAAGELIA